MLPLTIDIETSVNNDEVGDFSGNPHSPKNNIVWFGGKFLGESVFMYRDPRLPQIGIIKSCILSSTLLVGQNIKFDLLYLSRCGNYGLEEFFEKGGTVWDIQLAEYLLSGQEYKMQSLDEMCIRYGLPVKDDRIAQYWREGVKTEDIPANEMREYLKHDVEVTEKIFLMQIRKAKEQNQFNLIVSQMDALLATFEMEKNGIFVDKNELFNQENLLTSDLEYSKSVLHMATIGLLGKDTIEYSLSKEWNPESVVQQAVLLYGGKLKGTFYKPAGIYKTGKRKGEIKAKKVIKEFTFEPILPGSSTDEHTLRSHLKILPKGPVLIFIEEILNFRKLNKEMSTYILPYKSMIWKHDGCIHPRYNHTVTWTGRLSCSEPNLQNTSTGDDDD